MTDLNDIQPTYYVRHPDDTYSVADPQPSVPPHKHPMAFDARKWADDFKKHNPTLQLGTVPLTTWFANAIMAGFDEANRRQAAQQVAPTEPSMQVRNMAMLIKQLASALRRRAPEHSLYQRSIDYLAKHDLLGSPLRSEDAAPAQQAQQPVAFEPIFMDMKPEACGCLYAVYHLRLTDCGGEWYGPAPTLYAAPAAQQVAPNQYVARTKEELEQVLDRIVTEQSHQESPTVTGPIDANRLEQMAKERPNDYFLKGSGVLKLTGAIRQLERQLRDSAQQVAPTQAPVAPAFLQLKAAVDEMCAVLGAHGEISARDDRVMAVMDALYACDATPATQQVASNEILEHAAKTCEQRAEEHKYGPFWNSMKAAEADACAKAIRALKAAAQVSPDRKDAEQKGCA